MSELNKILGSSELGYIVFPDITTFKSECRKESKNYFWSTSNSDLEEVWCYNNIPFQQDDLILLEFPAYFIKRSYNWILFDKDKFIAAIALNIAKLEEKIPVLKNILKEIS